MIPMRRAGCLEPIRPLESDSINVQAIGRLSTPVNSKSEWAPEHPMLLFIPLSFFCCLTRMDFP